MTENLAVRGEGLAGLVAERIKECRETAQRWRTESRIVRINRAIGKDYANQLDALASLLGTALEAAAPASTARERELLQAVLNCETHHDERGHAYLKVPARSLNDLAAVIAAALATPSPQPSMRKAALSEIPGWMLNDGITEMEVEVPAATQEPAGSGALDEQLRKYFDDHRCTERMGPFRCWKLQGHEERCLFDAAPGSPRKVGEDGALREALADLIKMHDERRLVSVAEANLRVDKAREALSLSSPIEPPTEMRICEINHLVLHPNQTCRFTVDVNCKECVAYVNAHPSQASSEIREALEQRITDYLTAGGLFNAEMVVHDRVRDLLIDCRDALAPSRQGAAKSVEG